MTDEKIIEYVMDSPENTNPSVLDSMLKSNKVQPDWNQNDLTASDYIKNRPFYEEVTEVVMLSETSFEVILDNDYCEVSLSESFPYTLEIGEEYMVTFDGETNTYTAVDIDGSIGIASSSFEEVFNGNGWACIASSDALILMTMDTSIVGTHTISISGPVTKTHKIDNKYIDFKLDKTNPVGEGTFSLNRRADTDIGNYSFAEGSQTIASGSYSHAEGYSTTASGESSHAEGSLTTAIKEFSHAEGFNTIAASESQHVQGKYNVKDSNRVYAHIIGGGTGNTNRKNIHTVDWNGNAWYDGNIEGKALIIASSTAGSTKRFKVTVDDTGTLIATEVTS